MMRIPVRYLSMHNESKGDVSESNIRHREVIWEIDPSETVIVLVDLWSTHILQSHLDRYSEITDQIIVPLLAELRQAGVTVIHAPGFTIAKRFQQWEAYADEEDRELKEPAPQAWPPEEFRKRESESAAYGRPFFTDELLEVGRRCYNDRMILASAEPLAEDFVIASGRQLHRLLTDRKIKHLLYAGFSTDGCVQDKDYGTTAMGRLGYNIILIRDCSTGKESAYTLDTMTATRMAIQQIELYHTSTTAPEIREALRPAG